MLTAAQLNAIDKQVYADQHKIANVTIKSNSDGSFSLVNVFGATAVTAKVQNSIYNSIYGNVKIIINLEIDGYSEIHSIGTAFITENVYTITSVEYPVADDLSKYLAFSISFDTNDTDNSFKFKYKDTTGRTYLAD